MREPLAIGGFLPLETVYAFDPVPAELGADARHAGARLAGPALDGVPARRRRHVEYMAFPRMSALAEVVWTPAAAKDYADFTARLGTHLERLGILDVNFRKPRP